MLQLFLVEAVDGLLGTDVDREYIKNRIGLFSKRNI